MNNLWKMSFSHTLVVTFRNKQIEFKDGRPRTSTFSSLLKSHPLLVALSGTNLIYILCRLLSRTMRFDLETGFPEG